MRGYGAAILLAISMVFSVGSCESRSETSQTPDLGHRVLHPSEMKHARIGGSVEGVFEGVPMSVDEIRAELNGIDLNHAP